MRPLSRIALPGLGLLCLLLRPPFAQAQVVLYGHVTDGAGEALPGANVHVEGTQQGVATTDDGSYRLSSLEAGTHTIVVSAAGYRTMEKNLTLDAGEERRLDVSLEKTVLQGNEVVVTGTMRETRVKESPVKVNVVDTERLQQGTTSSNLMDLIGSVGGLSTQLNCGVCGTNAIRVNGVEGPNTAVLIDGMPIMGALASVYGLNGISPSIIDQVEVIKGPQSTLYGTQALGGVVNIITKNPANTPTYSADVYAKNTREGNVSLAALPQKGRFKDFVIGDVTLLGGLRFDHNGDHGVVTAPRLSAKYSPSERTTVRTGGGTGFRVVNVFTEDHAALTGSRKVVFEEDLAPERSRSVTASVEHIVPFGTNPLTVSVDGFYTRFSNKIIPNYDRDPDLIVYENLDGFSVTRGMSVGLDQNFTALPVTYNASFTLSDVYTQANGDRQAVTYAPDFTGNVGATYTLRSLGATVEYTGSLTGPKRMPNYYVERFDRDRRSPTFTAHDVKITKTFLDVNGPAGVGMDAYLSVENLFDYTQGSPLVDASAPFGRDNDGNPFDTIYTWGPMVGRTFSVGVRMNVR